KCNHKPVGGQCGTGENDSYVLGPHNPIVSIFTDVKTSDTGSDDTGGGDTDTDPLPWNYSGPFTYDQTCPAAHCTASGVVHVELSADGVASADATVQSADCRVTVPSWTYLGSHTITNSGGTVRLQAQDGRFPSLTGSYNSQTLSALGSISYSGCSASMEIADIPRTN
ncbi:MAG: hypothetical protein ACNS63_10480, partial [Candidatus Nitrospinota bacterium M3_3B_026]